MIRRLINGDQADDQNSKIGSNQASGEQSKAITNQTVNREIVKGCAVGEITSPTPPHNQPPSTTTRKPSNITTATHHATPKRSKVLQQAVARAGNLRSKPWRNLWQHEKLALSFEAAGRQNGKVFTLNLDPAREKLLLKRGEPADDLRRRISKELKAAFGALPAYGFTYEVSPTGKLHVHGVIVPPSNTEGDMKLLREALAKAGGKIKGKGAARQVDVSDIEDGFGWAVYCQKAFDVVCAWLGTNRVSYISNDLLRLAKG